MASKLSRNDSLGLILRSVSLKPPTLLSSALVAGVYAHVTSPQDLDDLLTSNYFEAVLWRFFHADASNSHLELLIEVAGYEYDAHGLSRCLDLVLEDALKEKQLMLRLLSSTLASCTKTAKLEAKTYLFFRAVVVLCPHLLTGNPLWPKWKDTVFLRFARATAAQSEDLVVHEVTQCFLLFCIVCMTTDTLRSVVASYCYQAFYISADNALVRWFAELMLFVGDRSPHNAFTRLQIRLRKAGVLSQLPLVALAALRDNVDASALSSELQVLPQDVLSALAADLGYGGTSKDPVVLASIVRVLALRGLLSWPVLQEMHESTEETLFDIFERNLLVSYFPHPLMPYDYTGDVFFQQIKCKRTCSLRKSIGQLVSASLARLEITEPAVVGGIKGSSKYFSRLERVNGQGSKATVSGVSESLRAGLKKDDFIALLELHKPNKFGGLHRMAKFGLSCCRLGRVTKNDAVLEVYRLHPEFDERFNAIVSLSSLCVDPVPFDNTQAPQMFRNFRADVRLTLAENEKAPFPDFIVDHLMQVPLTRLQGFPPLQTLAVVTSLLRQSAVEDAATVVVLPSKAAVDLFALEPEWVLVVFKFDSDNESISRACARVSSMLTQVSTLANHLGLSEYDFAGSIRNAFILYHAHIVHRWKNYLQTITESSYTHYPFQNISAQLRDQYMAAVAEHYSEIGALFADLERYAYFDKIPTEKLRPSDVAKLYKALAGQAKVYVVSQDEVARVPAGAGTVITPDIIYLPKVNENLKRVLVTGDTNLQPGNVIKYSDYLKTAESPAAKQLEFLHKQYIAGFAHACQKISVAASDQQSNLEEASLCLIIYYYMRSIGYPRTSVLVVCASPYTRLLISELHEERAKTVGFSGPVVYMAEKVYPCDYIIVSTHGGLRTEHYHQVASCSRFGLFFAGAETAEPFKLSAGKLEICPGERYGEEKRQTRLSLKIKDSRHLFEQISGSARASKNTAN